MTQRTWMGGSTAPAGSTRTAARLMMGTLAMVAGLATLTGHGRAEAQVNSPTAKVEAEIKAADAKRFEATTKNDFDTLASLLADDLTYVHSSAVSDTKTQYLDALRSGKTRYHTIEPSDVRVRVYGNTAIVTGVAKISVTANGQAINNSLRYTDVWVQRNNRWQMVAWQSTRLP